MYFTSNAYNYINMYLTNDHCNSCGGLSMCDSSYVYDIQQQQILHCNYKIMCHNNYTSHTHKTVPQEAEHSITSYHLFIQELYSKVMNACIIVICCLFL